MTGDDRVHPVETQWHYRPMVQAGFTPDTPSDRGFVRRYCYTRSADQHRMVITTGVHADYWDDLVTGAHGLHGTLQEHLESIS